MSTSNCFNDDPDITGLGVRINLYASALVIAILPETLHTSPLIDVCRANASMGGFALLVTAIIRTAHHELTLYHAIFILHMLFFLGIGMFPIGQYKPTSLRKIWMTLITACVALMFQGWALFVWARAPEFGRTSQPDNPDIADLPSCNKSIKYIFVFVSVSATALWLRILWMIVLGIQGLAIVLYLLSLTAMFLVRVKSQNDTLEQSTSPHLRPSRLISQLLLILSCVYAIIMLELYVHKNDAIQSRNDKETWTFGQILSLVMIASSFNEIMHFLLAYLPPILPCQSMARKEDDNIAMEI